MRVGVDAVDAQAQLYSIDHADVAKTDGAEIDLLFANVAPGTRAWEALRPIQMLGGKALVEIFGESAAHYLERLRCWKRSFAERGCASGV